MRRSHVEHVVRAAGKICDDTEFFIVGSQSLHGKYPDLPDEILVSQEVDIFAKNKRQNSEYLNAIGVDSPFHTTYGYYADPVDEQTAVLPRDWKNRVSHLQMSETTTGIKAYCIDPHDLVVAKLAAARDKDRIFILALLVRKLVNAKTVQVRIAMTNVSKPRQSAMVALLAKLVGDCKRLAGGASSC